MAYALAELHEGFSGALLGFIVLQIMGDLMEFLLNGDNLVHVMLTGDKVVRPAEAEMVAAGGYPMKKMVAAMITVLVVTLAVDPAWTQSRTRLSGAREKGEPEAVAKIINARGQEVGEAVLDETPHGVLIEVELRNYANRQHVLPGVHAFHIHAVGRCDPPAFESIGEHYNPTTHQHGVLNVEGMHVGDLLNLYMPVGQAQHFEVLAADATLRPGDSSLFDDDGSALVIHERSDDYRTDPTGNAGGAVACGAIERPKE